jgi:hypothetical protein
LAIGSKHRRGILGVRVLEKRRQTHEEGIIVESKQRWPVLLLFVSLLVSSCGGTVEVEVVNTPPLVAADFDSCTGVNNLGGQMGAAYNPPDSLMESYVEEAKRGCVARLDYGISEWSAFWIKLQDVDLTPYSKLVFDVRADQQPGIPRKMKVELKRADGEVSIIYASGIQANWKTMTAPFADFGPTGYTVPLSSFSGMQELVFTFEAAKSGRQGVVYLDNVVFEQ